MVWLWIQCLKYCSIYSLPWDQTTVTGYLAEEAFCIIGSEFYFLFDALPLLFFVFLCWHNQVFLKMFEEILRKLDHPRENHNNKQILCDLIRFHITVKE